MSVLSFLKKSSKTVYFAQYHALPVDKKFEEWGGAYVNCWICFNAADYISDLATFYIEKSGWMVKSQLINPKVVTKNDFIQDHIFLKYYEESLCKGYSLSFYLWESGEKEPKDIDAFINKIDKFEI